MQNGDESSPSIVLAGRGLFSENKNHTLNPYGKF